MEGPYWSTSGQTMQKRNDNTDSEEIQESTEEDEASEGVTDNITRRFTSEWKQKPRVH